MALMHLLRLAAHGDAEHLVAEADAEGRRAALHNLLDDGHRVLAGLRRIARAVRQEHAVGLQRHDVVGRRFGRHHRHLAAGAGEQAQDVALDAVVDGDDVEFRLFLAAKTFLPLPRRLVPGEALAGGDHRYQVHAFEAGPLARFFLEAVQIELAALRMGDHRVGHALAADQRGQRAGVDAAQAHDAADLQPLIEMARGAIVRRIGDRRAQDDTARARRRRHVHRLDIFVVGADIADMREGEGDQLSGVGRVGEDFLVPRHRGVEADFADGVAFGAKTETFEHGAVGKDEQRGRFEVRPG